MRGLDQLCPASGSSRVLRYGSATTTAPHACCSARRHLTREAASKRLNGLRSGPLPRSTRDACTRPMHFTMSEDTLPSLAGTTFHLDPSRLVATFRKANYVAVRVLADLPPPAHLAPKRRPPAGEGLRWTRDSLAHSSSHATRKHVSRS